MKHNFGICFINYEKNVIFLTIPNNASSTIRRVIGAQDNIRNIDDIDKYTVFSVIRNPLDRLVSGFLEYIQRHAHKEQMKTVGLTFNDTSPDNFIKCFDLIKKGVFNDQHVQPQIDFIFDDTCLIDFLFLFEQLEPLDLFLKSRGLNVVPKFLKNRAHLKSSIFDKISKLGLKKEILEFYKHDYELYLNCLKNNGIARY